MYLELQQNGFVKVTNGTFVDFRPTNSNLVRRGSQICVCPLDNKNNVLVIDISEIEGEKCSPPVDNTTVESLHNSLQQFFNPNLGASDAGVLYEILSTLQKMLDELKRINK